MCTEGTAQMAQCDQGRSPNRALPSWTVKPHAGQERSSQHEHSAHRATSNRGCRSACPCGRHRKRARATDRRPRRRGEWARHRVCAMRRRRRSTVVEARCRRRQPRLVDQDHGWDGPSERHRILCGDINSCRIVRLQRCGRGRPPVGRTIRGADEGFANHVRAHGSGPYAETEANASTDT